MSELHDIMLLHRGRVLRLKCHKDAIYGCWIKNTFWERDFLFKTLEVLTPESVVIDCGANVGNHAIFWTGYVKKVYSFEGNPRTAGVLRDNVERNNLNVVVVAAPVGNGERVHMRDTSYLGSDFLPDKSGEMVSVCLSDLEFEKIDLLKLDVEGAEIRTLLGARKLIERDSPIVVVEVHTTRHVESDEVLDVVRTFDFDWKKKVWLKNIGAQLIWKDGKYES